MPDRIANLFGEFGRINRFNKKNQYNPNVWKFQKRQINLAGNSRHKVYENQNYALNKNLIKNGIQSRGIINRNNDDIKLQNIRKFSENHEVLKRQKELIISHLDITGGKKLGEGSFGAVRELKNDKNFVIKSEKIVDAKEEFQKGEKIRNIINSYIKNYDFGGAQGLDNVAVPMKFIGPSKIDNHEVGKLIMPKADGRDGSKAIFGKSPLKIYGNKTKNNLFSIDPKEKGKALSVALQKVMILRALNEAGYANIDTKLENIMISEDGKVSMIDIGSIKKHGTKISDGFTPATAAPEIWNGNAQASSQADVFSDAIDRPYILFGEIAKKHIPQFPKMSKNEINSLHDVDKEYMAIFGSSRGNFKDIEVPVSWKFMSYEKATDLDVKNEMKKYEDAGFSKPTFPKDFTNAQKMRYMYYHLGFLKIQKEIGEVYPLKVIDSLAKLQAFATEPDQSKRLSCKDVENTLLHLMMSADQWGNGVFRINGMKVTPWSMPDQILPKNNTEVKKVSPKNNGQKAIKGENIQRPALAKVTPNRNRNLVNNKPGSLDLRNFVKNQAKNKNVAAKISDPKKAKIPPLFNKRFGNWFVDPQKRKQNAPKILHQKQNVKGNKILNKVLNSGANKLNDTLHQNFGD